MSDEANLNELVLRIQRLELEIDKLNSSARLAVTNIPSETFTSMIPDTPATGLIEALGAEGLRQINSLAFDVGFYANNLEHAPTIYNSNIFAPLVNQFDELALIDPELQNLLGGIKTLRGGLPPVFGNDC